MKRLWALVLVLCLGAVGLSGCGEAVKASDRITIVTTIFPIYDWTLNILGDNPANADVTLLLDKGTDLHSFQPTAADIMKISSCDLFIYVGGESDEWVEDVLKEAVNKNMIAINLLDALGDRVKEEELVEGMQGEEEKDEEEGEEPEYDEHVWLSLQNASFLTDIISDALEGIDVNNASLYKKNAKAYEDRLSALDSKYASAVASGNKNTILFGDRFPFRYMTDDYGLNYYAAFVGCSAETEASFETVTFLARKVDELSLKTVLTIENSDGKIAGTIVNNTASKDQKVLNLDSMQSVTAKDVQNGTTYLSIMESNLEVLKEALK